MKQIIRFSILLFTVIVFQSCDKRSEAEKEAENATGGLEYYENDKPEYVKAIKVLQKLAEQVLNAKMLEKKYDNPKQISNANRGYNQAIDDCTLILARDYISNEEHNRIIKILSEMSRDTVDAIKEQLSQEIMKNTELTKIADDMQSLWETSEVSYKKLFNEFETLKDKLLTVEEMARGIFKEQAMGDFDKYKEKYPEATAFSQAMKTAQAIFNAQQEKMKGVK
jgi:prophage DNA circulation protein